MADREKTKDESEKPDDLEVEPLSDESLDSVAGGGTSSDGCCSCANCSKDLEQQ